jgi:hypothetical protein
MYKYENNYNILDSFEMQDVKTLEKTLEATDWRGKYVLTGTHYKPTESQILKILKEKYEKI